MGGDLRHAPDGTSPTFLVAALRDPIGANLDRIQIVKGWHDASGQLQERVYDVAWSGDRDGGAWHDDRDGNGEIYVMAAPGETGAEGKALHRGLQQIVGIALLVAEHAAVAVESIERVAIVHPRRRPRSR